MAKRKFTLSKEERKELLQAYRVCKEAGARTRYQAVRLYGEGYPEAEIEQITGIPAPRAAPAGIFKLPEAYTRASQTSRHAGGWSHCRLGGWAERRPRNGFVGHQRRNY
ncbi:MAG: hypothetical protein L0Z71_08370 [Anaerolineae bacterium]|nr:hypothetical protein [Anaerolineae bacterium]